MERARAINSKKGNQSQHRHEGSETWYNSLKDKTHLRVLSTVQRTALIKILSTFRTVVTQSLEVEAHISPTRHRLKQRAQDVITNLCALPDDHPIHKVMERTKRRIQLKWNYPKFPLAEAMKIRESLWPFVVASEVGCSNPW